jgi:hypothetical protein
MTAIALLFALPFLLFLEAEIFCWKLGKAFPPIEK